MKPVLMAVAIVLACVSAVSSFDGGETPSLYTPTCWDADLDGDGFVGLNDFAKFASEYGRTDCAAPGWCNGADLDRDGKVNLMDLAWFAYYYGTTC